MTTTATTEISSFEELDYRESDGIQVSLLWSRATNDLSVLVIDTKRTSSSSSASPDKALDAFRHPFAYAESHTVDNSLAPIASAGYTQP